MLLSAFGVAFLWVVQIALFEPGYIRTTADILRGHIEPMASELGRMEDTSSLAELSKAVKGKVFLLDRYGATFSVYSMGAPANLEAETGNDQFLYKNRHYESVIAGNTSEGIINRGEPDMKIALGFPVRYRGEPAALFLYSSLAELHTMQALIYRQLFWLSAVLTVASSLCALFLTRHFTKPILNIKDTVDELADGNLKAKPCVNRSDELGQLSLSVEKLGLALRRVDALRRDVISNVSHELRSPLSLIVGYGEMVRDITWSDESRRNENLNLIIDEASRLNKMVGDILDYSQIQSGGVKLNLAEWNLYELVASEVEFGRSTGKQWNLSFSIESFSAEIPVKMDALKMSQVMRNLIGNAVNHTEDGECVGVSIARSGSSVRVSVANKGAEISEDDRKIIWERYQRAQHQGGRHIGAGIGLSLVSAILSAHGFDYGVDSKEGKNIFWFTVPIYMA
ncbi:two-component sensor histidine kinase [Synergistales bacterium]|nr:two-component sensor histidine kinase [Synergistales bacterium]